MAWSYVGAGAIAEPMSGNATPALPAGWAADDIFLCGIISNDNVNSTLPGGWTAIDAGTNNGAQVRTTLYYRRAVGGDTAPLVTHPAGGMITAVVVAYRGITTDNPPTDVISATYVTAGASVTLTFHNVGITTTVNNDLVVEFGPHFGYLIANASGYTGAPTPTERVDNPSALNRPAIVIADFPKAAAGATGSRVATISNGHLSNGLLVSFKPLLIPWTGKVMGVTNPAKVMGVDVANIAKVHGVA
ncbi:MAG TPA: hypothetical protein VMX96_09440 [Dehalococcoidia bacterium]|nr:hypothetical protein [Dehalococcoidia bacterium]